MRKINGIAYEESGDGEPVLLIHGSAVADAMLPLMREPVLAERFRLIRIHRRGLGASARHTGPFSIEEQAGDALATMQALGIERFHVVGYSYGAVTAVALALQAPESVRSLALLEPPLMASEEIATSMAPFAPIIELYTAGTPQEAIDGFMTAIGGPQWQSELDTVAPGSARQVELDAPAFFEVEVQALANWGFSAARGKRITQPTLHVLGSESGGLFSHPRDLLLASVANMETVDLPGLNHLLQMRAPALVATPVAEFLSRHPLDGTGGV